VRRQSHGLRAANSIVRRQAELEQSRAAGFLGHLVMLAVSLETGGAARVQEVQGR